MDFFVYIESSNTFNIFIMKRFATAQWSGTGKEGKGEISLQSGSLQNAPYGFRSRFEDSPGTNPEELIAAAHSGCFTMKTAFLLNEAGYTADLLETQCHIEFRDGGIKQSHLVMKGKVPGISAEKFNEIAQEAGKTCPVSQLLNTEIKVNAELI